MNDVKALLEQEERHYELPPGALERLEDLRDRRRRTKQVAAAVLTLLVLVVAVAGAIALFRSSERRVPAEPPDAVPTPTQPATAFSWSGDDLSEWVTEGEMTDAIRDASALYEGQGPSGKVVYEGTDDVVSWEAGDWSFGMSNGDHGGKYVGPPTSTDPRLPEGVTYKAEEGWGVGGYILSGPNSDEMIAIHLWWPGGPLGDHRFLEGVHEDMVFAIASRLLEEMGWVGSAGRPPVSLERAEGLDPVRLSTSIGEIEFTTWVLPDGGDPPWRMTETDHGVIASLPPDGMPAWSLDGVTWTEIPLSVEPGGPTEATAYGDDLFVFVDGDVHRAVWDGSAWTEAGILPALRVDGGAAGPRGIVTVRGERVDYWDGAEFTVAARPPDRKLHLGPSARCSAPGWVGKGIMAQLGPVAATDDGFIALAARSEGDWYKDPVCEPLVWLSPDGDTWTPTSDESPFGERSFVVDLTVSGGRIVTVGGVSREEAAVWVSDDGTSWERADLDAAQLWQVAGGARGWIAVGNHDPNFSADLAGDLWFSTDGLVWDGPYERPPAWADATGIVGVAMLDDLIVGTGEQFSSPDSPRAGVVVGKFIDG